MQITSLIEDTCSFPGLHKEKGLSLYITTNQHKILFDCGSGDGFLKNAEKLAIDLSLVDIAFISHGHFDHGLGIENFLRINTKAKIYIQKKTFGKHYVRKHFIYFYGGLNQKLRTNPRFIQFDGTTKIDNELQIISQVPPKKSIYNLFTKIDGKYILDPFEHEQSLVISENGSKVLISGCSHCGIERIHAAATLVCGKIDILLGGFHLIQYDFAKAADLAEIDELAHTLLDTNTVCYTCHCTSTQGYLRLKQIMSEKIGYLSTGNTISI